MTGVIMTRIEAINKGELPEGYKRTKAGIMPEDWDGAIRAKQLFKSHTDKKHNGDLEILASTQERGIVPRSQIGIDIQCSDEGVKGYKKVSKGDFVISLRSFQGGIEYSEYDGIVSPAYTILKPINDISAGFYRNYFKTDSFIDRLNGAVYGIRDGKQIGYEDFGDMYVHCPPLAEQERIAEILMQCDKVIELKQELIFELTKLKKERLRTMFPVKDHDKPEVRFSGFSDSWELRKLGEVAETVTDYVAAGSFAEIAKNVVYHDEPDYAQLVRTMDLKNGFASSQEVFVDEKAFNYLHRVNLDKECIILPNIGNCGEVYFIRPEGLPYKHNVLGPNAIYVRSETSDNLFLSTLFQAKDFQTKLALIVSPSGQTKFNKTELKQIELKVPATKNEQYMIASYFEELDNLITLHQRELEESKKKKKALAKLLLTGIVRV